MQILSTLILLLISLSSVADDFSGKVGYRQRIENEEDTFHFRDQYKVNFKYKHEIGSDSCISINAGVLNGSKFDSTSTDFSDGNDIALRHLYFDFNCLVNKSIQVGAIHSDHISPLDLEKNGWIDGIKIHIDLKSIIDELHLTYGSVNTDASTNVFERVNEDYNQFIRATLVKKIKEKLKATLALTSFNDEFIYQGVLEYSLNDVTPLLDELSIYTSLSKDRHHHTGIEVSKEHKGYKISLGYVEQDNYVYPTSSFYSKEDALYISVSKTFKQRLKLSLRARKGRRDNRVEATIEYKF